MGKVNIVSSNMEETTFINENSFAIIARYSLEVIENYKENVLPSVIKKYSDIIDSNWSKIIEKYKKVESKETSAYFFTSFAPDELFIGSTFNNVINKNGDNILIKSRSVILAILDEWTLLPIESVGCGHRCICMIDFPEGMPSIVKNMPEVEKVTNIYTGSEVWLCN